MTYCTMVRKLLFVLVLASLASQSYGQRVRIGARVIPHFTGIINDDDAASDSISTSTTVGFAAGIAVGTVLSERISLEMNILFSSQGQNYSLRDQSTGLFQEYELSLNYVKIPILFRYMINPQDNIHITAYGGPQLSLLVEARERVFNLDSNKFELVNYGGNDITTNLKYTGLDLSAVVGFYVDFRVSDRLQLYTGIRGDFGLLDLENKDAQWRADGENQSSSFYDNFFGPKRPIPEGSRTAKSTSWTLGFTLGLTYIINNTRDPDDYHW